jgi:hypothetical protein
MKVREVLEVPDPPLSSTTPPLPPLYPKTFMDRKGRVRARVRDNGESSTSSTSRTLGPDCAVCPLDLFSFTTARWICFPLPRARRRSHLCFDLLG